MQHSLGIPETRKFLGHTLTLRNYPPTRLYGMYRNNIILARKYPQFTYIRKDFRNGLLKQIVIILLFESNRMRKLTAILRGCFAGLTKRL